MAYHALLRLITETQMTHSNNNNRYQGSHHEFYWYAPVGPIHIVDGGSVELGAEETLHALITDVYQDGALIALHHCPCHHLRS